MEMLMARRLMRLRLFSFCFAGAALCEESGKGHPP